MECAPSNWAPSTRVAALPLYCTLSITHKNKTANLLVNMYAEAAYQVGMVCMVGGTVVQ